MKEEQKNLTIGQIADMKKNVEENIKNQLNEFINQIGCNSLEINGYAEIRRRIDDNDTIDYDNDSRVKINILNFI